MKKFYNVDYIFVITLAALIVLSFLNLGNQYLWQDEAENAVIAENILEYGYPRALDENYLVVSDIGYRENHTWIFQPWLQNYVTALSFKLAGSSTTSARFPFVIFGILSFIVSYNLAKRIFSLKTARISSILLLTCVPYLLMIRQARYYSLALFFALILIQSYLDYVEKKRFSEVKILFASFFLFNSNFGLFFQLITGLLLHYSIFHLKVKTIKRDLLLAALMCIILFPLFVFYKGWAHGVPLSVDFIMGNIKFYLRSINRYIVPIRIIFFIYLFFAVIKRKFIPFKINSKEKNSIALILIILLTTVLFMGVAKFRSLRYVIYLIPLLLMLESYILARWMLRNKILPVLCIIVLIGTDIFHHSLVEIIIKPLSSAVVAIDRKYPHITDRHEIIREVVEEAKEDYAQGATIKSFFQDYIYEITHDYNGPIECIVEHLKTNAKSTDTVNIPYGDCAVAFYTDLKVDNKPISHQKPYPEWIILRDYWSSPDLLDSHDFDDIFKRYERITLNCSDIRWENRPDDLGYHKFRTVRTYPKKVTIFKKIRD